MNLLIPILLSIFVHIHAQIYIYRKCPRVYAQTNVGTILSNYKPVMGKRRRRKKKQLIMSQDFLFNGVN